MTSPDVLKLRSHFPIFSQKTKDKPVVYLDNAATTQKPARVIDKVSEFYSQYNANVHRTIYKIGERATHEYEEARRKVAEFINADPRSIVFTRGTTESINLVASAWGRRNLGSGDDIVITEMEHHSNIVPWQMLAKDTGASLRHIPLKEDGTLNLTASENPLSKKTKIMAFNCQSNALGTVNPVEELVKMGKDVGALILLDGAQSVPHFPTDVEKLDCDFLAFSGHKMMGPSGIGVLFASPEILESMDPFMGGGEMITTVSMEKATWKEIPWKFEAGTPNIAQAIGLGAAVDFINEIGMETIEAQDKLVTDYALDVLKSIPEVTVYGDPPERGPAISFNVDGIHPHDLAQILDRDDIAVRAGHHCAQPTMTKLGVSATTRASFYLYNTTEEIDLLRDAVLKAIEFLHPN